VRLAYADPPYPGQAKIHYSHDPRCAEVDHAKLIAELETYDGWALSSGANLYAMQYVIKPARKLGRDVEGLTGAKPPKFCQWMFTAMGAEPGDQFVDLFPGTGVVGRAWDAFNRVQSQDGLPLLEANK
jgi:hypothetical protein